MCINNGVSQSLTYDEALNGLGKLIERYEANQAEYDPVAGHQKSTVIQPEDIKILKSVASIMIRMRGKVE